jgi:hypothetical protein
MKDVGEVLMDFSPRNVYWQPRNIAESKALWTKTYRLFSSLSSIPPVSEESRT